MICWWCGSKLTDPFGHRVEGVVVTLPGGMHQVRVHKICQADAKAYLHDEKVTAKPHDDIGESR